MASFCGFLVLLACFSSGFGGDNDKQPSCSKVKIAYRSKRLAESDVPVSAVDGGDLRVCPRNSGKQCCSARMEERFAVLATTDFNKAVSEEVGAIKALFNEQAKAFDGFVQQLIKKSQIELDTMFKKIYGSHYVMNTKLFMDLFVDFTYYYNGRNSDITNVMETFFASLMRRMFQIMNMQFQFSNSYLDCVSQHAKELKPFGDEPEKLIPQVKKSLVQARTFSQALHLGRDVVSTLGSAVSSSKECENQLIALKYCSWCKALTSLKPCHKFCTDVHRDCLANVVKVNPYWQEFLNTLSDLVARQTGPLNIQDVIGPINLKISFAIMNFQNKETQEEVRDKIFKGCGRPGGMSKRSTDDFFIEGTNNRQRRDDDPALIARSVSVQPNLDTLVTSYKKEMIEANNFWRNLPDAVCDGISKKDQNSGCWNGISNGSYTSPSDTDDPRTETNSVIQGAIDRLKEMVNQLKSAMEGEEVNMIPPVDESGDGSSDSGSGSGETSGDNNIISEYTVEPSSPQDNVIDDESEQEGGVGKPNARPKNSALQHVAELWLLSTMLFVLLSTL